jgi:hypothetical protein
MGDGGYACPARFRQRRNSVGQPEFVRLKGLAGHLAHYSEIRGAERRTAKPLKSNDPRSHKFRLSDSHVEDGGTSFNIVS